MDDLYDFDIISYKDTNENISNTNNLNIINNKSTQINNTNNIIYLILHDTKCYGYTTSTENAMRIITKLADDQVFELKKNYPESNIYYEFDKFKNIYKIYSVNKMIIIAYDSLETVIKFVPVKYMNDIIKINNE